jgi:DNA-binding XRE family transcriptional regulator
VTVPPAPSFGDLLKKHRTAAGVTQEYLAELACVSANAISSLERGARRDFEDAAESVRARVPQRHDAPGAHLPAQLTSSSDASTS